QIEVSVTTNSIYICDIKIEYEELIADPIAVSGVEFTLSSLNLTIGNTSQLAYQVLPNDATNKNVSFMSSNSTIASVSSTGLVSALKKGSATITITTEDGDFTDTILLTVNEPISYTPELNLDDSGFKKSYTFKEELDLAHLSASYKASDGTITQLDGNDLTLVSGGTNTLGPVTLIFSYASLSASVNITVTNVGATQGSGQLNDVSLTLNGTNADPSLSTGSTSDYASIAFGDFEFSGKGLRNYNGNLFISSSGYIYNKDPLNDIASIEMNYVTGGSAAAVQDFRFASSVISSTSGVSVFKNLSTSTGGTTATVTAPSNSDYFRIDISNKNLQATIKINFKSGETLKFSASEQADAYYDYFMDLSHEECLIYDVKLTTWNILKTEYQAMVAEGKELLSSSAYQDLLERYILIVTKYGYEDFLGLNISGGENKNFVSSFMSPSPILLITLLTISGVLVSMNVIFLKKKRKDN
ncbi:MAG: Ig-like domain-containing protein, partial [Bacilli bacterium]